LGILCLAGEILSLLEDSRDLLGDTRLECIDVINKALIDILSSGFYA
jgi:hypothetical protein